MNKELKSKLNNMENGIKGFYRTASFKTKIIAIISAIVIVLATVITTAILFEKKWEGKTYIFATKPVYYKNFMRSYEAIDDLLKEKGFTLDEFAKNANATIVFLSDKNLGDVLTNELNGVVSANDVISIRPFEFYFVIYDEKGELIYQGKSASAFCKALRETGF